MLSQKGKKNGFPDPFYTEQKVGCKICQAEMIVYILKKKVLNSLSP